MSREPLDSPAPLKSSRRNFLKYLAGIVGGIGAAAYLVPMSGFLLGGTIGTIGDATPYICCIYPRRPVGAPRHSSGLPERRRAIHPHAPRALLTPTCRESLFVAASHDSLPIVHWPLPIDH